MTQESVSRSRALIQRSDTVSRGGRLETFHGWRWALADGSASSRGLERKWLKGKCTVGAGPLAVILPTGVRNLFVFMRASLPDVCSSARTEPALWTEARRQSVSNLASVRGVCYAERPRVN